MMPDARTQLDRQYLTMRERVLSLAADFDRLQRLDGGDALLADDVRIARLRACLAALRADEADRAERVQMTLSDHSPDPRLSR